MGFGQVPVEFKRLLGGLFRLRESLVWRQHAVIDQHVVAIGQSRVGLRLIRIGLDRLLEEFDALQNAVGGAFIPDRKSTRLNSSHLGISYAVFCLKKKKTRSYLTVAV